MQRQTGISVERLLDGKMRVTSNSWGREGVLPGAQVLEVRNVDGRLHVARKERRHDQWDLPVERYDPYTPGKSNDFDVITDDASLEVGDASPSDE